MKTVAYLYLLLVILPDNCAMRPGVGETNWSTEIHSPGLVGVRDTAVLSACVLHRFRVCFP